MDNMDRVFLIGLFSFLAIVMVVITIGVCLEYKVKMRTAEAIYKAAENGINIDFKSVKSILDK